MTTFLPPCTLASVIRHEAPEIDRIFVERRQDRRADPVLGALIDVAIAYRENLGGRVAKAFMCETGVPEELARRVLDRLARQRSTVPRRLSLRCPQT